MTLTPQSDLKAGYSFLAIFQSDMKGFRKSVHNASPSSECSVARETLQRMFSAEGLNTWLERVSREHRGFQKIPESRLRSLRGSSYLIKQ